MYLIDSIKRRLHRDIVADPVLHALVLNLYLNGERYPHTVDDYFQTEAAPDAELAARMREHFADEDRHVALYAKAIERLGQPVLDLPEDDIFNHVIRIHTPTPWRVEPGDSRDVAALKLAHFMAHAHCLEKRVARSLDYHLDACAHSASPYPAKAVAKVLADEHRHVSYTREAVNELLPTAVAAGVWAEHERAEHKGNLDFSARQLGRLMNEQRQRFPRVSAALYRACLPVMRWSLARA